MPLNTSASGLMAAQQSPTLVIGRSTASKISMPSSSRRAIKLSEHTPSRLIEQNFRSPSNRSILIICACSVARVILEKVVSLRAPKTLRDTTRSPSTSRRGMLSRAHMDMPASAMAWPNHTSSWSHSPRETPCQT